MYGNKRRIGLIASPIDQYFRATYKTGAALERNLYINKTNVPEIHH
jgi:hypothetical protein